MKKILAFAMAAVLMLGLAACGGSGASAPASSAAGSASASSGASGQDSAGGTSVVEEIQEKGVLTMMTATGFPPFEYLGEDGKPAGVDIDLAQLVADELGVELEVLDMDFNLLIESLKSGKGQLIAAGMTATPERAEQIDFSITYTLNGLILLVPKGSDIKTADDLAGKNIAVQTDVRLMELGFGAAEGMRLCDLAEEKQPTRSLFSDPEHYVPPAGGETYEALVRRCRAFLDERIVSGGEHWTHVLVVAHGAAVRGFFSAMFGAESGRIYGSRVQKNCAVNVIDCTGGLFLAERVAKEFCEDV